MVMSAPLCSYDVLTLPQGDSGIQHNIQMGHIMIHSKLPLHQIADNSAMGKLKHRLWSIWKLWYIYCLFHFLACSRACASKVFSLRADCGRVIVYPGLKQWERPRHNIFGVCTRLAGGVCMSTSANSSASKHLTVTKIVWKIVYVTFDYLISHFFKILSLEFMANLFRDLGCPSH